MDSNAGSRASSPLRRFANCDDVSLVITHHVRDARLVSHRGRFILIRNAAAGISADRAARASNRHPPNFPTRCRPKKAVRFSQRQITIGFGLSPERRCSRAVNQRLSVDTAWLSRDARGRWKVTILIWSLRQFMPTSSTLPDGANPLLHLRYMCR